MTTKEDLTDKEMFLRFADAYGDIDYYGQLLKDSAIRYAEWLHEVDPKSLVNGGDEPGLFLADAARYDFDRWSSDDEQLVFTRTIRGIPYPFEIPAEWYFDEDDYKADYLERLQMKQEDGKIRQKQIEKNERAELKRLQKKYGS